MVKKIFLILIVVAVAGLLGYHFLVNDEQKIRKKFTLLTEYASRSAGEKPLAGLQRAAAISSLFTEAVDLHMPGVGLSGTYGPPDIKRFALMFRNRFPEIRVRCYDIEVSLVKADQARLVATCRASSRAGGDRIVETRETTATLERDMKGNWLFSGFEFVEVLQR